MLNISFSKTKRQVVEMTKTVTRRLGWKSLKPGTLLCAVEKGMGLKKGEKVCRLNVIEVLDVSFIPAGECSDDDARREGFPEMTGEEFAAWFCREMKVKPDTIITRIEFRYRPEMTAYRWRIRLGDDPRREFLHPPFSNEVCAEVREGIGPSTWSIFVPGRARPIEQGEGRVHFQTKAAVERWCRESGLWPDEVLHG